MKNFFKKSIILIVILTLILSLTSCTNQNSSKQDLDDQALELEVLDSPSSVNIASMKGPTTIGLASIIDQVEKEENLGLNSDLNFEILAMPEEIVTGLAKKEFDLATVPANLAASLYNKTDGEIQVLSINTLGVLHMVENGENISSPEDLNGKTIYSIGKGTTPEAVLNNFINYNKLDLKVEYKSEASEIAALLNTEEDVIAMIPEPFVSVVENNNKEIKRIFDMNKEWEETKEGNPIVTGVLVGRKDFIEDNPDFISNFLDLYKESINKAKEADLQVIKVIEDLGIIPEGLGEDSIKNCNIEYIDSTRMKDILGRYLEDLFNFKKESIGGSIPSEDFYY